MGHKLQLILKSMFQAPPTWNNLYLYLMQRQIPSSIVLGRQELTSWRRKESIVEPHTFSHILKLGMYFAITL
jgi:hypothetical protein